MWNEPADTSPSDPDPARPVSPETSTSSSGIRKNRPKRVRVRIIRPDGSSREEEVAGYFREEHLCSMVDDELCRLDDNESLILHLFDPDRHLIRSLRNRWREELSDNRHVFVREVLGPTTSREQLVRQLQKIQERMTAGERVNLAIRSPQVAKVARRHLRKMLLISQEFEESLLNLWVFGNETQQREILDHLGDAGMVRVRDYEQVSKRQTDQRWHGPWIDLDARQEKKQAHRHQHKRKTSYEAVSEWIKRVEADREHPSH